MSRYDKYPPGTDDDVHNLPPHTKVMGLHPLVWGAVFILFWASIGIYSKVVGFYDIEERMEHGFSDDDDKEDNDKEDDDKEDD